MSTYNLCHIKFIPMEKVSAFTIALFIATTAFTFWFFWKASNGPRTTLLLLSGWLALTAALGLTGFFLVTDTTPPRFGLLTLPPLFTIILLMTTERGKTFINTLKVEHLVLLHVVRVPVELVLHSLFVAGLIPQLMTYEGLNFDIFSGITAPVIYYFGYVKKTLSPTIILIWNVVCLALLINIVTLAVLSSPVPFQQLAFDQPNMGVLYFPFVWLPGFIVPIVLLSHCVTLRSIVGVRKTKQVITNS